MNEEQERRRQHAFALIRSVGINAFLDMMGPQIMRTMKDAASRVIWSFPKHQDAFKAREKGRTADGGIDWVTDADEKAQRVYVKLLTEDWVVPFGFGIIGEEDGLRIECSITGVDIYFTVDPYDGTGALVRGQSDSIGTMIALVCNGRVVAVCIGDVNSQEMYYFRPGSEKTHRLFMRAERASAMLIDPSRTLNSQRLLLRSMLHKRSDIVQRMVLNGLFHDAGMANGSIGISMARLWKGEVGGAMMAHGTSTPWDTSPVVGLSQRLGFEFFEINEGFNGVQRFEPVPPKQIESQHNEILVVHGSRMDELHAWCRAQGIRFAR